MRMRKMRHPKLDRVIDVSERAVEHYRRGGWELVDDTASAKAHPANTPATDPAEVREPVGDEAPADPAGKSTLARRARTEGSA